MIDIDFLRGKPAKPSASWFMATATSPSLAAVSSDEVILSISRYQFAVSRTGRTDSKVCGDRISWDRRGVARRMLLEGGGRDCLEEFVRRILEIVLKVWRGRRTRRRSQGQADSAVMTAVFCSLSILANFCHASHVIQLVLLDKAIIHPSASSKSTPISFYPSLHIYKKR